MAIVGWSVVALVVALFQPTVRRSIVGVVQAFTSPAALFMAISSAAWNTGVVWALWRAGVWSSALWFDTLSFAAVGTVALLFQLNDDRRYEWRAFLRVAALSFGISVLLEAFVYNYVFSLPAEIVLVPWIVFWGLIQAFVESKVEYVAVHRIATRILVVTGSAMIVRSIVGAWRDPGFLSLSTLSWLLLPLILTACYLPYLALLRVWMAYEQACTPLKLGPPKRFRIKLYIVIRYVAAFGLDLAGLSRFRCERYSELRQATSRAAVDALF